MAASFSSHHRFEDRSWRVLPRCLLGASPCSTAFSLGFKLVRVQALTVRKLGSACAPGCGLQVARRHGQSSFVTSRLATASLDAPLFCMGQGGSAALLRPWPAQEAQSMRRAQSLGASCIPQAVQDKEASSSKSSSVVWNSSEGVSMSSKCAAFDVTSLHFQALQTAARG